VVGRRSFGVSGASMAETGCRGPPCPASVVLCHPDIYPLISKRLSVSDQTLLRSVCRGAFAAWSAGVVRLRLKSEGKDWVKLVLRNGAQPRQLDLWRITSQDEAASDDTEQRMARWVRFRRSAPDVRAVVCLAVQVNKASTPPLLLSHVSC
jgi:hypothetical protein